LLPNFQGISLIKIYNFTTYVPVPKERGGEIYKGTQRRGRDLQRIRPREDKFTREFVPGRANNNNNNLMFGGRNPCDTGIRVHS